jgi:hypothetical protein
MAKEKAIAGGFGQILIDFPVCEYLLRDVAK